MLQHHYRIFVLILGIAVVAGCSGGGESADDSSQTESVSAATSQSNGQIDLPFGLRIWSEKTDRYGVETLIFNGNQGLVVEVQISRNTTAVLQDADGVRRRMTAFGEEILWGERPGQGPVQASWSWKVNSYQLRVLSPSYWTQADLVSFAEALVTIRQ